MSDFTSQLADLSAEVSRVLPSVDLPSLEKTLADWREQMSAPDFWRDREKVRDLSTQAAKLEKKIHAWREVEHRLDALHTMAAATPDLASELAIELSALSAKFQDLLQQSYLSGPHDEQPAIMTIMSGAGGVDAQDWAAMLERMYLRFIEAQGWSVKYLSRTAGSEAGIKSSAWEVRGDYAYGYLKNEAGVHRLVRLSPFDADHARHTSFAMVEVLPEIPETALEIKEQDLKIETFRSSGHGGQSVNTTDSAVRITHLPTGISVVCQNERSQIQNRRQAMTYLRSRLQQYYQAEKEEEKKILRGEYTAAAWGNQIRSYVLHPYQMVKDHRTDWESSDTTAVLDGDLWPLIKARLAQSIKS